MSISKKKDFKTRYGNSKYMVMYIATVVIGKLKLQILEKDVIRNFHSKTNSSMFQ